MKDKKLLISFILLFCICLPVSAQRTVNFWFYGADNQVKIMEQFIADFEAEHPDIKVQMRVVGAPGIDQWIVAIIGGVGPDVTMGNLGFFKALTDAIQPLDEFIANSDVIDPADFWPAHWDAQIYGGQMMGLPFRANSQVIIYNKDLFEEAAIAEVPTTWDDFAFATSKLTQRSADGQLERWGYSFRTHGGLGGSYARTVNHWAERNGWISFNEDYTEAYYTDPALIETLEYLYDLTHNFRVAGYLGAPEGKLGTDGLAMGTVAMLTEGPWSFSFLLSSNPNLNLGTFLPPVGPSGRQPYANMGGENLIMFKTASDKEAAFEFMVYLARERNLDYNRIAADFFPVVNEAVTDPYFQSEMWQAVMQNYIEGIGKPNPAGAPGGVEFLSNTLYEQMLEQIFYANAISPAVAMTQVQAMAERDIAQEELRAYFDR